MLLYVERLQSFKLAKFAIKIMLRHFGFEATVFAKSLLKTWSLGDPGSIPGCCKLLGLLIFGLFDVQGKKLLF